LDGGVWWYWRVVAMQGWRPVEDLVRWGFAHAPVVMANEAHNGLTRCVRTREVGVRMVQAWVRELLEYLSDVLAAHGGTAGILRDQAPPLLAGWDGVDALVVSTDNEMTA
jgi:hypothetical protein